MSYKTYLEDAKRTKRRNLVAKNSYQHGGPHLKSHKAERVAVKKNIKSHFEDLLDDSYDLYDDIR